MDSEFRVVQINIGKKAGQPSIRSVDNGKVSFKDLFEDLTESLLDSRAS